MSTEQVARLLADFDRQEPSKGRSRVVPFDHALHSNTKAQPPKPVAPPPEDDAYQRGLSAGYATARTEYERKLNDEREKFETRLGEERSDLLNETAARIADNIEDVGKQLEARIAGVTARILEPLISSAVQRQAAASFVEKLSSITGDSQAASANNRAVRIDRTGAEQTRRALDRGRASRRAGGRSVCRRGPDRPRNPGEDLGRTIEIRGSRLRWLIRTKPS